MRCASTNNQCQRSVVRLRHCRSPVHPSITLNQTIWLVGANLYGAVPDKLSATKKKMCGQRSKNILHTNRNINMIYCWVRYTLEWLLVSTKDKNLDYGCNSRRRGANVPDIYRQNYSGISSLMLEFQWRDPDCFVCSCNTLRRLLKNLGWHLQVHILFSEQYALCIEFQLKTWVNRSNTNRLVCVCVAYTQT